MKSEQELKAVVSGSFGKFKPEIDLAIDELNDLSVTIIAPSKGWLYVAPQRQAGNTRVFRPLPSEIGRTIKQIEDEFLESIEKSDFVYVVNPEGFIGETVAFELGFAIGKKIPVYSEKPIPTLFESNPLWTEIVSNIKSLPFQEIIKEAKEVKTKT